MSRQFLNGVNLASQSVTAIGAQMSTNLLLGRSTAGAGSIEQISIGSGLSLSAGTLSATAGGGSGTVISYSVTATSKTLVNGEICTVTAAGQTITLPASPTQGWQAGVSVAGTFTDTIIARNGSNIMSLAENMTVDTANISVTLVYIDATRGWRIF
jgi:hypothetical protein